MKGTRWRMSVIDCMIFILVVVNVKDMGFYEC